MYNYKKIISMIIIVMMLIISGNIFAADNDFIDVKVGSYSVGTQIKSEEGFIIYDEYKNDELRSIDSNKIKIKEINNNNIVLQDDFENEYIVEEQDYLISSNSKYIEFNNNKYRGYLSFRNKSTINHIDVNDYLYGVVPKEIHASANIEALKAQAVVARSFAYANINKHKNEGFDLCTTTHCQVYGGYNAEKGTTNNAVDLTRGEYISYNGVVANTPYNASSGGYIESSKNVWGGNLEHLEAKVDPYSENDPYSNWTLELNTKDVESKLKKSGINVGNLTDIVVKSKMTSGRVNELEIKGSSGSQIITGNKFRTLMGNTNLKSTLFTVEAGSSSNTVKNNIYIINSDSNKNKLLSSGDIAIDDKGNKKIISGNERIMSSKKLEYLNSKENSILGDSILIKGSGYGHGVGMSQYGAMEMAKQGFNYEDIIKHYYVGVEITKK